MTPEPVGSIGLQMPAGLERVPAATGAPALGFEGVLSGLEQLNTQLLSGEAAVAKLALDPTDNLHHTVIGMERTRLSFELMLAVRNKVLEAYQELMRMQV